MCVCDPPPSPYHSSISRGIQLISGDGVSKPSFYASLMTFNYFGISLGGGSGSSTGSPPPQKKNHTHTRADPRMPLEDQPVSLWPMHSTMLNFLEETMF